MAEKKETTESASAPVEKRAYEAPQVESIQLTEEAAEALT